MSRVAHPAGPRHGDVLPADHPPAAPNDLNALHPGIWPRGARRAGGVLTLGGADVRDLAAEFGTPLYVCDEDDVRSRCREYLRRSARRPGCSTRPRRSAPARCCAG